MACACKANRDISYLEKKYGDNQPRSKATNIRGLVEKMLLSLLIIIILIPFTPIIIAYLIVNRIFSKNNKGIIIDELFKIRKKKDGRSK